MVVRKRKFVLAVFTIMVLAHMVPPALTCSCIGPSGRDILPNSEAVFAGEATAVEFLEPDTPRSEPPIRVTFQVREVWKGPARATMVVDTVYNKYSCSGYFFKQGHHYLVAVSTITRDDARAGVAHFKGVSLCGGTSELSNADESLKELGDGEQL